MNYSKVNLTAGVINPFGEILYYYTWKKENRRMEKNYAQI